MQYRRLGKTGLKISALGLGGHWKGLQPVLGRPFQGSGYDEQDLENIRQPDFLRNRDAVLSCAAELGINYIDACSPPEILAYAKLLKGRRDVSTSGIRGTLASPGFPSGAVRRDCSPASMKGCARPASTTSISGAFRCPQTVWPTPPSASGSNRRPSKASPWHAAVEWREPAESRATTVSGCGAWSKSTRNRSR